MNITRVKNDTALQPSTSHTGATHTAFMGHQHAFSGSLTEMLTHLHGRTDEHKDGSALLIFDNQTGRQQDFDLRGTLSEVLERHQNAQETVPEAGRGRPKLGVVSREVSLLPRHWEWLERQGNASATLRRLIDEERRRNPQAEQKAQAQAATDRFMLSIGGDLPGYQEATRALYAGSRAEFAQHLSTWPADVRDHALRLAEGAFGEA